MGSKNLPLVCDVTKGGSIYFRDELTCLTSDQLNYRLVYIF